MEAGPSATILANSNYAKSHLRVSKDDMFMILALWMEEFPLEEVPLEQVPQDVSQEDVPQEEDPTKIDDGCKKVGAVLVLPNDIVWAAECTRDGVHAVASLLMKHHERANGCRMFMSRKPCRICTKLLVQSKVKEVLYLPLKPEYYLEPKKGLEEEERKKTNNYHMKQVDRLFITSPIAQKTFVPQVEKSVLEKMRVDLLFIKKENTHPIAQETLVPEYTDTVLGKEVDRLFIASPIAQNTFVPVDKESELAKKTEDTKQQDTVLGEEVKEKIKNKINIYHFGKGSPWLDSIEEELPWPAFDHNMKEQVRQRFVDFIEWSIRTRSLSGRGLHYKFKLPEEIGWRDRNQPFDPTKKTFHEKQAKHFIEMARLLSQRTDDPKTGVGAVIVSYPKMEIVSIGWNGFPRKAHYGEFARASHDDDAKDNKFPYVIHAEQNALMMRNNKNIENAILFVTKSPCDECAPLIAKEGIKTVVVDADVEYRKPKKSTQDEALPALGYNAFPEMVKKRKFVSYQTEKIETQSKIEKGQKLNNFMNKFQLFNDFYVEGSFEL